MKSFCELPGLSLVPFRFEELCLRTCLVLEWIRIRLPVQGTWVRSLVQEDPTCHGATKPVMPQLRHKEATAMSSPHTATGEQPRALQLGKACVPP